jgi:electron transfer flavoprotein beta subunit
MKVVVCIKQIPDPATPYTLEEGTNWLVRTQDQVLDDGDRYGVEMGLQIAQANDGTVTLITMGPSGNSQGIRQALAMGADKAVVVESDELRGSDSLTTAKVLAAAIAAEGFDLVITGTESTDGYTGIVPQMVAEMLDVPALTYASKVEASADSILIHRQTADGYDVVVSDLPAVVAVTAGVVEPRYPTFKGIMDAKKKPVETRTPQDLSVDIFPTQQVASIVAAPERGGGRKLEDDGEAFREIIVLLEDRKVI